MTERIFTYGMLLRSATAPAALDGWRLAFNGALATIEQAEGEQVLGGTIDVDADDLGYYDSVEGVDPRDPSSLRGLYRRIPVRLTDGTYAWVYLMNDLGWSSTAEPSDSYLRTIEVGYELFGYDFAPINEALNRRWEGAMIEK